MSDDHQPAVDKLAQVRDELKLKLHLAGAELQTHWEALEQKWTLLQSRLVPVKQAGDETAHDVKDAVKNLAAELGEGYERFKTAIHKT
jgi:hypothetical protein